MPPRKRKAANSGGRKSKRSKVGQRRTNANDEEEICRKCSGIRKDGNPCTREQFTIDGAPFLCHSHQDEPRSINQLAQDQRDVEAEQEEQEEQELKDDDEPVKEVQWVIPRNKNKTAIEEQYGEALFGSSRFKNMMRTRLSRPPVPSPLIQPPVRHVRRNREDVVKQDKEAAIDAHRTNESSKAMKFAAREVQDHFSAVPGRVDQMFLELDPDSAVIVTYDEKDLTIFGRLDTDRIELMLEHDGEEQEARVIYIVRVPDDVDGSATFFLELPSDTTVNVNGQTFANTTRNDFRIGPLDDFTIIELYGLPVFFYRSERDRDFRPARGGRQPTSQEILVRQRNRQLAFGLDRARILIKDILGESSHEDDEDVSDNSKDSLPEDFNPCEYYHLRIDELREQDIVAEALNQLLLGGVFTLDLGHFLSLEEVVLGIAAVTAAITSAQDELGGFSMLAEADIQACFTSNSTEDLRRATRFGRPLIVPYWGENHIILLVIQLDQDGEAEFSFVDSRIWHFKKEHRQAAYGAAENMFLRSKWDCGIDLENTPGTATWIAGAQQASGWTCGYYTILNGWALAMGLELNTGFIPESEDFFNEVQLLVQLASVGFADWRLIYSFLLCYGFIADGQTVPTSRRFSMTYLSFHDNNAFDEYLERIRDTENMYWTRNEFEGIETLELNEITLPEGTMHDDAFTSDYWRWRTRDLIPDLAEHDAFNPSHSDAQIRRDYAAVFGLSPAETRVDKVAGLLEKASESGRDALVERFHQLFRKRGDVKARHGKVDMDPCTSFDERFRLMVAFDDVYGGIFEEVHEREGLDEMPSDETVIYAVAAVVQAIDSLQASICRDTGTSINSGFALALPTDIAIGRILPFIDHQGNPLPHHSTSRARRCWLLPLVVDQELMQLVVDYRRKVKGQKRGKQKALPAGHTILVVLQEEQVLLESGEERSEFHVYFLDSAPQYLSDVRPVLYESVRNAARNLRWSTHRNANQDVAFSLLYHDVSVPSQTNETACGLHTILNGWILAMGLTPAEAWREADIDDIYGELHDLILFAYMGLLDWETLAAWFFCRGLVTQSSMSNIPENRRFARSFVQTGYTQLSDYIAEARDIDRVLEATEDVPYDHGNNVDFSEMPTRQHLWVEGAAAVFGEVIALRGMLLTSRSPKSKSTKTSSAKKELPDRDGKGDLQRGYDTDDWDLPDVYNAEKDELLHLLPANDDMEMLDPDPLSWLDAF